jgi:hypothetical protein
MLTYAILTDRPREFLAATGLTHAEFARLLPAFAAAYAVFYPPDKTCDGKVRQRQVGGGTTGALPPMAAKLLFLLVYQQTNPLHTLHGLPCQLRQPQPHSWIHPLLPVLHRAFAALGVAPERDARRVATSPLLLEGAPNVAIDGTERRRQRPQEATAQTAHDRSKKKAQTEKNLLLVHENTRQGGSLGPPIAGKTPDKKAADEAPIASPTHAPLDQDTGFQGDEPQAVLTTPPKKSRQARP